MAEIPFSHLRLFMGTSRRKTFVMDIDRRSYLLKPVLLIRIDNCIKMAVESHRVIKPLLFKEADELVPGESHRCYRRQGHYAVLA